MRENKNASITPPKITPNKVWKNHSTATDKTIGKISNNNNNNNNNSNNNNSNNNKINTQWNNKKEEPKTDYGLTEEEEDLFEGLDEDDLIEFAGI